MSTPSFDPQEFDGLNNRPGFMLRRCIQATGSVFGEGCRDLGLTSGQYDILHILNFKGEIDQDELARALGLDRATTGAIATTLERKSLIVRHVKPTDRRKRVLTLTKAGGDIFTAAQPAATSPHARAPLQTNWR